jgi:hypothetical protein
MHPSAAKAGLYLGWFMYGLKPVPFIWFPVYVRAESRTLYPIPVAFTESQRQNPGIGLQT